MARAGRRSSAGRRGRRGGEGGEARTDPTEPLVRAGYLRLQPGRLRLQPAPRTVAAWPLPRLQPVAPTVAASPCARLQVRSPARCRSALRPCPPAAGHRGGDNAARAQRLRSLRTLAAGSGVRCFHPLRGLRGLRCTCWDLLCCWGAGAAPGPGSAERGGLGLGLGSGLGFGFGFGLGLGLGLGLGGKPLARSVEVLGHREA